MAYRIVQLSHDVLSDRVMIGIQGPTPADFISVNCALPDKAGRADQAMLSIAVAEAARLLAGAARALLEGQVDDPVPAGREDGRRSRFTCECCGVAATNDGPPQAEPMEAG